ncbi:hypothetical protein [Burkholderia sp. Bp9012]|uniref:hypothetical protein n=1 Tax=Burkholderia sp. Bp9012 TaxID=2184562 RepID=UPI000F5B67EF|nr:hypothetical protein [Burkholderia sp. Bp9012]
MLTVRSGALLVAINAYRFLPGAVHFSQGVIELEQQGRLFAALHLTHHLQGDWGVVDDAMRKHNDVALHEHGRLVSRYDIAGGRHLCIVTEADRSATSLRLDDEPVLP